MSSIALPEAEHTAGEAGPRSDAQALIAEARAHARRRRLKMAAALAVAVVMSAAGVLIARAVTGTAAAMQPHPRAVAAPAVTGFVTGYLPACFGVALPNRPLPVTPGTVTVVRGRITSKPVGPGTWRIVYPNGPVLAREHISDNYTQTFRFALPPGQYVLEGSYDAGNISTAIQVTVTAGKIARVSLPSICM